MATETRRAIQKRYDQKCKTYCLRLRKDNDADLIDWINRHGNLNGIIRNFLRQMVENEKNS